MNGRVARLAVLFLASLSSQASADSVTVRALFHSHPEDWCSPEEGIPVTVEMAGLLVHTFRHDKERNSYVRVRRGGEQTQTVDVRPVLPNRIRQRHGSEGREIAISPSLPSGTNPSDYVPLGLFRAQGNVCLGLDSKRTDQIAWSVDDKGAAVMRGEGRSWDWWNLARPTRNSRYPTSFTIGKDTFFVLEEPEFRTETVAFSEPERAIPWPGP